MAKKIPQALILSLILAFSCFFAPFAGAQADRPENFATPATAIDAGHLLTASYTVTLWGIEPVELSGTSVSLRARTDLDNWIDGQPVRCDVRHWAKEGPIARCLNHKEQDLALLMVQGGYAVVNRPAVTGTVFERDYIRAEKTAQDKGVGGWGGSKTPAPTFAFFPAEGENLLHGSNVVFLGGLILGFVLTWVLQITGFRRLEKFFQQKIMETDEREGELREQERFVVASMIEGELSANKGKLEAFVIIYKDLLKSLRQSGDQHRYQISGEIVHEAPLLERSVFESNLNRLELLGGAMARDIIELYGNIQSNPTYTTLDSSVPQDEAILKVQRVLSDAENMIPKLDEIINALHITIRDKQVKQAKTR